MALKWNYKTGNVCLIYLIKRKNISKSEIGRMLNVSGVTLHKYLNNPYLMTLQQIYTISAMLDINTAMLVYLFSQNAPKDIKHLNWFNKLQEDSKEMQSSIDNFSSE
jgi:hypothetical protein